MSTLTQARDRGTEQLRDAPRNERLLAQNLRTDAAINNMIQGFIMFDAAERIVVCNQRFIDMYGLSREIVKLGCFGLTLRPAVRDSSGGFFLCTARSQLRAGEARPRRLLFPAWLPVFDSL
jgi:PAS domain-containing protein